MGDFEEKLERILGNPQAMEQIMSLAQSLNGSAPDPSPAPPPAPTEIPKAADSLGLGALDPQVITGLVRLLNQSRSGEDERTALLEALRPFVKEQRYAKLDKAIQIARLSRLIRMALELFRAKEDSHV